MFLAQEPQLMPVSIYENIAYGLDEGRSVGRSVPPRAIRGACGRRILEPHMTRLGCVCGATCCSGTVGIEDVVRAAKDANGEGGREGRGHALARVMRVHERLSAWLWLLCLLAVHDFILSLPQKYSTCVGENSVSLSGGKEEEHLTLHDSRWQPNGGCLAVLFDPWWWQARSNG